MTEANMGDANQGSREQCAQFYESARKVAGRLAVAVSIVAGSAGAMVINSEQPAAAYDDRMYVEGGDGVNLIVETFCDNDKNLTTVWVYNNGTTPDIDGELTVGTETVEVNDVGPQEVNSHKFPTEKENETITFEVTNPDDGAKNTMTSSCHYNSNSPVPTSGYWMISAGGQVYGFGRAQEYGHSSVGAVDMEPTPSSEGYWITNEYAQVQNFGDAPALETHAINLQQDERVTSLSRTPSGEGYWLFTNEGRVLPYGDAQNYGDMSGIHLNGPVLDSIPTPSGNGYYMVASDGGVFTFGDAKFAGSTGNLRLNKPVQSLVPDPDGNGYWLVASDGGVFAFDAPFRGSMGDQTLNKPVTGMVPFGNGYLMVAEDGGIFNFSGEPFLGSLADNPPFYPIVAAAAWNGSTAPKNRQERRADASQSQKSDTNITPIHNKRVTASQKQSKRAA